MMTPVIAGLEPPQNADVIDGDSGFIAPTNTPVVDTMSAAVEGISLDFPIAASSVNCRVPAFIPLIDLNAIESLEGAERRALIEDFGKGLTEVGFVAVKAESLTSLISLVYQEMGKYFSQPVEEKMKDWDITSQVGFSQQGRETAAGKKIADIKETFFIPPGYKGSPGTSPSFNMTMARYHAELTEYTSRVVGYVAEYLGEPTEDVSASVQSAKSLLRLAYYPAPQLSDDVEAVWAAEHTDVNLLTLLPPATMPGLELLTKEGNWESVVVPEGYLIVNVGEQLEKKTGGRIKATPHRVLNPGGEFARRARFSTPFFGSWSEGFSLTPFTGCLDEMTKGMTENEKEKYLKDYPNVEVGDYVVSRLIEIGLIKEPPEKLVAGLLEKGLLKAPLVTTKEAFPHLF
jgi:isopenicillin N synthase-like dioxygenase